MYDVSVVIPNYNGIKYLEHCLEALGNEELHLRQSSLIIVRRMEAPEAAEKFPQYAYLYLDQNYGFCRAVNEGIRRAEAPFVVLLKRKWNRTSCKICWSGSGRMREDLLCGSADDAVS